MELKGWEGERCGFGGKKIIKKKEIKFVGLLCESSQPVVSDLAPKWVRLAQNGTTPKFKKKTTDFSTFWLSEPKCTKV